MARQSRGGVAAVAAGWTAGRGVRRNRASRRSGVVLWQGTLVRCLWQKRASHEELWRLATGAIRPPEAAPPNDLHRLLMRFAALDPETRRELLARFTRGDDESQRVMLAPSQLTELTAAGVAIGCHEATHLPLSLLADPAAVEAVPPRPCRMASRGACGVELRSLSAWAL